MKMNCTEAFLFLKPVCDKVIKNPTQTYLQELIVTFSKIPTETLLNLQHYVLYPLELHLQNPIISSETKKYIVDCIKQLVKNTGIRTVQKFLQLYSLIFIQIFDKDSHSMVANVSEELKLSVIQCATVIIQKCDHQVVEEIYNKNNIPKISQGIFLCVYIMKREKLKSLKIAAIKFLMAITHVDDQESEIEVSRSAIADTIMYVVPGVITGLHEVMLGDEKQGYLVTKTALQAWSQILVLVLEDISVEKQKQLHFSAKVTERIDKVSSNRRTKSPNNGKKDANSLLKEIRAQCRTTEWAESVSENVTKMTESLRFLQHHSHWKVRLELATACHSILNKCYQHLEMANIVLIEILLSLSDDETNQVCSASQEALRSFVKKLEEEHETALWEILQENFFNFLTKLPRIIHVESESVKISSLKLLKQYIILLGEVQLPQFMQRPSNLQRAVQAILQVAELQSSNLSLLNDCSLRDFELNQDAVSHTPWKQFKNFADKETSQKLQEALHLLGKNGDLEILCNHLLELLEVDAEHRNETVFILNEIILGGAHTEENVHLVKNILDTYLSSELWYIPIESVTISSQYSSQERVITINQVKRNIQLACLLAEGVGNSATALGTRFNRFLMHCLYLIVERAGSPHEALSTSGLQAAAAIAKAIKQGENITSLLSANFDYFMVQVSLRLRNMHRNPEVLSVLSVAMSHSNQDMLLYMQNAVSDILLECCDTFQIQHASLFLHVFYTFFLCIKRWFPNNRNEQRIFKRQTYPSSVAVMDEFFEYLQNCQIYRKASEKHFDNECPEEMIDIEAQQENYETDNFEEDLSQNSDVPTYVQMTISVLQRCLHLLPRKDKQCQLQAIETITEGLEILAPYENKLHPIVHQVWSPLVGRLQDNTDPLLLNRSFGLLRTLARLALDFIRTRTLKQVWPPLCSFLVESAEVSKNKSSAFHHTQLFKLQVHLLQGLGDLISNLQLLEREIYQILTASAVYLSRWQPKPLQESCVNLFFTVAAYDADAVWLQMERLKVEMESLSRDSKEFQDNVHSVLLKLRPENKQVFQVK